MGNTLTNQATHTPGPWKWGKGVDDDDTRCFVTQGIDGQPEYLIAEIENGAPGDCLQTEEANARLIAAAPDLLESCRVVLELLDTMDEGTRRFHVERAVLRHAVEKAEGTRG